MVALVGCGTRYTCRGLGSSVLSYLWTRLIPADTPLHGTYGSQPQRDALNGRTSRARTKCEGCQLAGRGATGRSWYRALLPTWRPPLPLPSRFHSPEALARESKLRPTLP